MRKLITALAAPAVALGFGLTALPAMAATTATATYADGYITLSAPGCTGTGLTYSMDGGAPVALDPANPTATIQAPDGTHTFVVTCTLYAGTTEQATATVDVSGQVSGVTPTSWAPGDIVTITAGGFAAGEQVQLLVGPEGGVMSVLMTATADANGNVVFKTALPDSQGGVMSVMLKGLTSGATDSFTYTSQGANNGAPAPAPTAPAGNTGSQPGLASTGAASDMTGAAAAAGIVVAGAAVAALRKRK